MSNGFALIANNCCSKTELHKVVEFIEYQAFKQCFEKINNYLFVSY